ncbi:MAG TPA: lipoprotein [Pyrinomonadaceae bacterium]|jgi:hypothetical protein
MKRTILFLVLLAVLSGCSVSSPTSTVKKYISSAEKGDVNTMVSLYSSKEIQKTGMEKLRSGDQLFSDLVKKTIARGEILQMTDIKETITGNTARVSFVYQDPKNVNSLGMGFDLSKENGSWKIDEIGKRTPADSEK